MKRKIIKIDEALCNGCGQCVSACAEGAIAMVDGKAKLVSEVLCDGFGHCLGACPTGALEIIEVEAEVEADPLASRAAGPDKPRHDHHHDASPHQVVGHLPGHGGCPGSALRSFNRVAAPAAPVATGASVDLPVVHRPELAQWPVMLRLVPPSAPFLAGKELVVLSTCSPVAFPDLNWRYLRGRAVVVACPKLDNTQGYAEKLADIIATAGTPKVIVLRMAVPCCRGLTSLVEQALELLGPSAPAAEEVVVALEGGVQEIRLLSK
jgi:NAD-dependent dihydropyrimidine dehydrogenase PreA subunit